MHFVIVLSLFILGFGSVTHLTVFSTSTLVIFVSLSIVGLMDSLRSLRFSIFVLIYLYVIDNCTTTLHCKTFCALEMDE
ncbi:hypothetical protein CPB85DRAFT_235108 [Mucidula mucida]|nr:hypothetical protein CPB85DRAFT_235108 [Mucidula mucida]